MSVARFLLLLPNRTEEVIIAGLMQHEQPRLRQRRRLFWAGERAGPHRRRRDPCQASTRARRPLARTWIGDVGMFCSSGEHVCRRTAEEAAEDRFDQVYG